MYGKPDKSENPTLDLDSFFFLIYVRERIIGCRGCGMLLAGLFYLFRISESGPSD